MPIYDFQCAVCGHQDEVMRKMSAESTMECPSCNKETFSKMPSAPSFQLKGTGWYATDFNNNNKTEAQPVTKPEAKPKTKVPSTTD